jgi:hypothetical protein
MTKAIMIAALLAGACVAVPDPNAEEEAPAAAAPSVAGRCDATRITPLIGQPVSAANMEEAKRLTGAKTVRALRPGDIVTMEYREDRLNLRLDGKDRIEGASCG